MTTFNVSTTAALHSALASARSGDTILLGGGTYAGVSINNLTFTQDVTIASANPNAQAVLTGLDISGSTGLTLRGLELYNTAGGLPFRVQGSQDIHFDGLKVHGSLDGNPQNDGSGLFVRSSTDVSIENSEFQQLSNAIEHSATTDFVIRGNNIHDIRSDGIQGNASTNIVISNNQFRDFYPSEGDHGDAIQFWTVNATASARGITITDNVVMRGSGSVIQGVFLGNERNLPYLDVKISGNLIAGGNYHGITVSTAKNVVVENNIVQGFVGQDSWIALWGVEGGSLKGNASTSFTGSGNTGVVTEGSVVLALATDQGAAAYQTWLAQHAGAPSTPTPTPTPTPAPAPAPTSPLGGTSGADTLRGTAAADSITGQDGNDSLAGGAGNDTIDGGAGNDTIAGDGGSDLMRGGAGSDYYFVSDGDTVVEDIAGAAGGLDHVYSYANFTLGPNIENLQLADAVEGTGNDLANSILGDGTANRLRGMAGADTVNGRDGADTLDGGAGADLLIGGPGSDRFVFNRGEASGDQIQDFAAGDRLELSGYSTGSTITKVAGSTTDWKILDAATGSTEIIKLLNGYQLSSGEVVFG